MMSLPLYSGNAGGIVLHRRQIKRVVKRMCKACVGSKAKLGRGEAGCTMSECTSYLTNPTVAKDPGTVLSS